MSLMPSGVGSLWMSPSSFTAGIMSVASGSSWAQCLEKVEKSLCTRVYSSMRLVSVKRSRITARKRLSRIKKATDTKPRKYGMATHLPCAMRSCITDGQFSPVSVKKSKKSELPKLSKLMRSLIMPMWSASPRRCTPRTENTTNTTNRMDPTCQRLGSDSLKVRNTIRMPVARLVSLRMRAARNILMTRMSVGSMTRLEPRSCRTVLRRNDAMEVATMAKSRRFHESPKYSLYPIPMIFRTASMVKMMAKA
mmetsp:Transcript_16019/g.44678  ORF Transcript_16019/g.44678 Transcript_16019/m.44678 type:complete len:251 (-) Transcript_16019:221-973(-)